MLPSMLKQDSEEEEEEKEDVAGILLGMSTASTTLTNTIPILAASKLASTPIRPLPDKHYLHSLLNIQPEASPFRLGFPCQYMHPLSTLPRSFSPGSVAFHPGKGILPRTLLRTFEDPVRAMPTPALQKPGKRLVCRGLQDMRIVQFAMSSIARRTYYFDHFGFVQNNWRAQGCDVIAPNDFS